MIEWVLVITMYAGFWSSGDSVALTNVPGFTSEAACKSAGAQVQALDRNTKKDLRWICISKGGK